MARCSRCGHESDIDMYVCDNCEYHLITEKIEDIPFFKRPEDKWYKPDGKFKRLIKIINPMTTSRAFRDINKKKDKKGPRWVRRLNALMVGLWVWAIAIHITIEKYQGIALTGMSLTLKPFAFSLGTKWVASVNTLAIFLCFFIFGIFYYGIIFKLYNFAFSIAANFSVQLDGLLAIRYNVKLKKSKLMDRFTGRKRIEKKTGVSGDFAVDRSSKQKALKKLKDTGKYKIMNYAYAPLIVVNFLSFIFLLIFLPSSTISDTMNVTEAYLTTILNSTWSSWIWSVLDVLQIIGLLWVALTMSIAQREIGNTNTTKLLIGNLIVAGIIIFTTIILRPTLGGGSINLIETLFG